MLGVFSEPGGITPLDVTPCYLGVLKVTTTCIRTGSHWLPVFFLMGNWVID